MKDTLLEIKDLHVEVAGKEVIKGLNLEIKKSETVVLLGQNGSGKTSFLMAILGFPAYRVTKGDIIFGGKSILGLSIDRRAKLGIGLMFQRPPTVRGVKLRQLVKFASPDADFDPVKTADDLLMSDFLDRDVNMGFSGGETKRSELLQIIAQSPQLALLDEPESGVDLENLAVMGKVIDDFLKAGQRSALIITHTGYILDYVTTNLGCVLSEGTFHCIKNPKQIINDVRKYGYEKCLKCRK